MGVDINMSMGVGVHFPPKIVDEFVATVDPDGEYGIYEVFEELIYTEFDGRGLTLDWVGNSWLGDEYGVVVWAKESSQDMGREAQAGVYRFQGETITLAERLALNEVSRRVAGKELPIEPLVTVTVS